jgi:hypothetical protein
MIAIKILAEVRSAPQADQRDARGPQGTRRLY